MENSMPTNFYESLSFPVTDSNPIRLPENDCPPRLQGLHYLKFVSIHNFDNGHNDY